ncbi:MAG: lactonase family protein [Bryobacterales bacterium]|nr:lactonase family protein [Bryobacterales bacterium]
MSPTRRSFLAASAAAPLSLAAKGKTSRVYFGTYTRNGSKGIYTATLDTASGKLSEPELAAEIPSPSFVTLHPNGKFLYAVSEMGGAPTKPTGTVTAFSLDAASGKLNKLNTVSTKGEAPCHLNVDKTGRALVLVNYSSGSTACMPVRADGSLGEAASFIEHKGSSVNQQRQRSPHAHSANISFNNRFVVVADLGTDQVLVYKLDPATATLTPNDPPFVKVKPGGGPRHFTFHPKGKYGYVINEMGSAVTAFTWDANKGVFNEIQHISTLPDGFKGVNNCAEVVAHPNGKFLYGSNRGHNSLAVFKIDGQGKLTAAGHVPTGGEIPRNFAIAPGGKWLLAANQNTNNVVVFAVDPNSGNLTPTGQQVKVGAPVCIRYLAL